jgi:hypothetical protein
MFSIANSLWSTPTTPQTDEVSISSTEILSKMTLDDPQRFVTSILIAPTIDRNPPSLAALTDNLGRIIVLDTDQGQIIRVFKGMRDAQVAWLPYQLPESSQTFLLLVAYSNRGVLEIFLMRDGRKILAVPTERDLKLIQVGYGIFGGTYRKTEPERRTSGCFLLSNSGQMSQIVLPPELVREYVFQVSNSIAH